MGNQIELHDIELEQALRDMFEGKIITDIFDLFDCGILRKFYESKKGQAFAARWDESTGNLIDCPYSG